MVNSYKDLIVYKKSYEVSLQIHKISMGFPSFEREELGSQIRRASKSIPMNIAEGYGKNDSLDDTKRFFRMALGSCEEVKVQLDFCYDLKYIDGDKYKNLIEIYNEISKMLVKMIKDWKKRSSI